MKKINIGLFGIALNSNNFGVTALGVTQVRLISQLCEKNGIEYIIIIFSGENLSENDELSEFVNFDYIRTHEIVRLRTGIHGWKNLSSEIKKCDIIIDLTYGDSFSDIYGIKNFILYCIPKIISIKNRIPLIIGPQTIGPYYSRVSKVISKKVLNASNAIYVRDHISKKQIEQMCIQVNAVQTSDLAMELPYNNTRYMMNNEYRNAGFNISQLLWNNNMGNIQLTIDYHVLVESVIDLLANNGYKVHLIAHVYDRTSYNEYSLIKTIHEKFPETVVAPEFSSPMDAKSYISKMDVFIGSRMHATIAAISSGVPVIPLSYSRKFEGLFKSIGYDCCIDCTTLSNDNVIKKISDNIFDLKGLKGKAITSLEEALRLNEYYKDDLEKFFNTIVND